MKEGTFRDLIVYRCAYAISLEIYKRSTGFPTEERYAVTDQIRRCATGICANIAEGYGRQMTSDTDFRRFLVIAKGSAQEAIVWTDYCKDLEFIDHETWEKWKNEYDETSRMLFAFIRKF